MVWNVSLTKQTSIGHLKYQSLPPVRNARLFLIKFLCRVSVSFKILMGQRHNRLPGIHFIGEKILIFSKIIDIQTTQRFQYLTVLSLLKNNLNFCNIEWEKLSYSIVNKQFFSIWLVWSIGIQFRYTVSLKWKVNQFFAILWFHLVCKQ